ncbi:MAG TPA: hypothetical protein VHA57_00480 [Actinomycetota bacterium]|nr:hypothetical protein [Actinomycetota bacterium]
MSEPEPLGSVPAGDPTRPGNPAGAPLPAPGGGAGIQQAHRASVPPGAVGRGPVPAPPTRRRGLSTAQMALLTFAGLVMGILALLRVNSGALGDLGLITVAGPTYFVAVGLVLLSFGFALVQQPLRRPLLAFQIIGLIVLLDGLGPLVEPHASFATAWLHAGFASYIAQTGHTLPTLDARFSWPGFFALAAVLSKVAGLHSPEAFLAWAPLVFNLIYLPPLYAICRSVTRNERVWWMALALFYLASWVGQDYFSPQAVAFFLFLVIIAVVLRWFRPPMPDPGRGNQLQRWLAVWMRRLGGRGEEHTPVRSTPVQRGALIAAISVIFFGISISHQLTPFLLIGGLIGLVVFGRTTLRGLPVLFALIAVAWISLGAVTFWTGHLSFIFGTVGKIGANVDTSLTGRIQGSAGRLVVLDTRIALAGAIFLLALIGAIRRRRRGYGDWSVLILAFAPFPLLVVQAYGGEALLRAYLFALPFVALLAAMAFLPSVEPGRFKAPALAFCLVAALFAPSWLIARYGNERFDRVSSGDLAAVDYVYQHAPPHSVLLALFPQLPWRYQAVNEYDYEDVQNTADPPSIKALEGLAADSGLGEANTRFYLILTQGQEAAGEALDSLKAGWEYQLGQTLVDQGLATVLYQYQGGVVLQLIAPTPIPAPPGQQPAQPANPGAALS